MATAAMTKEPHMHGCKNIMAMTFPGHGHINAMMNMSLLLAAHGAEVTLVVTEEWLDLFLASSPAPPAGIRLRAIPNVIPSEHNRAADHSGFLNAAATKMVAPFEHLLNRLKGQPPAAFLADTYVPWFFGVGNQRGVPVWSLFPMSPSFFSTYDHFDLLPAWLTKGPMPASGNTEGEKYNTSRFLHR
jgi:hypothetical protein